MPDYQPTRKRSNQQTLHRGHPKRLHTAGDVAPKELHDAIVRAKPDYQPTRKRGNQQTLHSGHSRLHRAGDTTPKELHDAIEHALHERLRTAVKAICDASPVPRALFEKAFLASTPCAGLIEDSIALNMALKELHWAIDEILDDRLQTKVKQVCDESPESRALFEEALLTEATPSKPATRTSGRKKRARFVVCLQCKEDFDVSQKEDKTVCQFHPGEVEVKEFFWDDDDHETYGEIDTADMRACFPQGFWWDCCREREDSDGCQLGRHRFDPDLKPKL